MTKMQFLMSLHNRLSGLPRDEIEERLNFYSEMIEDRMEEGLSEEEAVSAVGSVGEIASQIIADFSFAKIAGDRIKPKRHLKAWEIILLALGSPLWLSLAVAVLAVILGRLETLIIQVIDGISTLVTIEECQLQVYDCLIGKSCIDGIMLLIGRQFLA